MLSSEPGIHTPERKSSLTKSETVALTDTNKNVGGPSDASFACSILLFVSAIHQFFRFPIESPSESGIAWLGALLPLLPSIGAVLYQVFFRFDWRVMKMRPGNQTKMVVLTILVQAAALCIVPLPLRADGSLAYRITGGFTETVTGTEWTFRLAVPLTVTVMPYNPNARIIADQLTCEMEQVPAQAPAICEVSRWTISADIQLTELEYEALSLTRPASEFQDQLSDAVCRRLATNPETQRFNRERVDVLHDAHAQESILRLTTEVLAEWNIESRIPLRVSGYAVRQPRHESCKTRN